MLGVMAARTRGENGALAHPSEIRKWTLKILFPANQHDSQKCKKKAKNKTNLQQCISLHITLPQNIHLQKDTKALEILFPATQNDYAKNARKAKNKTKLQQII